MNYSKSILAYLAAILVALLPGAALATDNLSDNLSDTGGLKPILEVSAVSITIDAGKDVPVTYKIVDATSVTLSGAPANADALRPGMVCVITLSDDGSTALAIHASNPKK